MVYNLYMKYHNINTLKIVVIKIKTPFWIEIYLLKLFQHPNFQSNPSYRFTFILRVD
jgi:hypothetical protein